MQNFCLNFSFVSMMNWCGTICLIFFYDYYFKRLLKYLTKDFHFTNFWIIYIYIYIFKNSFYFLKPFLISCWLWKLVTMKALYDLYFVGCVWWIIVVCTYFIYINNILNTYWPVANVDFVRICPTTLHLYMIVLVCIYWTVCTNILLHHMSLTFYWGGGGLIFMALFAYAFLWESLKWNNSL